ncbi:hypothetical protein FRX31_003184, partial [Thalictrum thalictroides]
MIIPPSILRTTKALWKNALLVTFYHGGEQLNRTMVMRTLAAKWNIQNPMDVICEAPNKYICRFENAEDRNRIENMQPWHLCGHIVLMTHFISGMVAATHEIETVPIWLTMSGLHLEHHSLEAAAMIASAAGTVKKIEFPKSGTGFRAKVGIKIAHPLVQGTPVNICDGDDIWIAPSGGAEPPIANLPEINNSNTLGLANSGLVPSEIAAQQE